MNTAFIFRAGILLYTESNTFLDKSSGFFPNVLAPIDHRSSYQPTYDKKLEPKKPSGSKACDPITVLDDDETDAAEVIYIDLENDNEVPAMGNYTAQMRQAMAATQVSGSQSVAKNLSSSKNIQGPDPAKRTERITYPLFRSLTKHDIAASTVGSESKATRCMGFKAWYGDHDVGLTRDNVPETKQKATSQTSIKLFNEKRVKNTAGKDRDAPQFEMSVLNSNRKRTMGELGYHELISPAQIESPSEKLARMARKRRQRQERCGPSLQNTNTEDVQSATEIDHAYGYENDRMTREKVEMPLSPIVRKSHDSQKPVARLGDERGGPSVVREPSPVGSYLLTNGHRDHVVTQPLEDHSDGHMNAQEMRSKQSSTVGHGDSINDACSSDSVSRKLKHQKSRRCGPTNVCGVFSPETKPPVKKSHQGPFHCPRCDSQFTTSPAVNYHFEGCVTKYGNPKSLKWSDHSSLEGVPKRAVPISKDPRTIRTGAQVSAASKESTQSNVPIIRQTAVDGVSADTQITIAVPIVPMSAPLLDSDTRGSDPSTLPAYHKDYASPKVDQPMSPIEHRITTACKGLSHETLKRFQETGSWSGSMVVDQNEDQTEEEETEIPDISYQYHVRKREWLETEEDAIEFNMGPFHTLYEANAVAKAEVQSPHIDDYEGFQSTGWSYYYEQDGNGLQKHRATVLDIHFETAVHRGKCHCSGFFPEIQS